MSETEFLLVGCPHCGMGLRVGAAVVGKQVKCPSCYKPFQVSAHPDEEENDEQPESKPFPWMLVGLGSAAILVIAVLLVLWVRSHTAERKARHSRQLHRYVRVRRINRAAEGFPRA
ncbi:MAG: hypothetical protein QXP01_01535 [Candidatus Hadarchaeum sp.]